MTENERGMAGSPVMDPEVMREKVAEAVDAGALEAKLSGLEGVARREMPEAGVWLSPELAKKVKRALGILDGAVNCMPSERWGEVDRLLADIKEAWK